MIKSYTHIVDLLPGRFCSLVESIEYRGVVNIVGRFSTPALNVDTQILIKIYIKFFFS